MRNAAIQLGTLALAIAIGTAAGCGGDSQTPRDDVTLEDLRSFDEYAVYSVGESFDGLAVSDVQSSGRRSPADFAAGGTHPTPDWLKPDLTTVSYGTCTSQGSGEGGCSSPLSITSSAYCARPIEKSVLASEGGLFDYRGAKAGWASGGLVLFFRDSVVNITSTALDYRDVEMRVADHMVAENAAVVTGSRTSASEDFGSVTATCAAHADEAPAGAVGTPPDAVDNTPPEVVGPFRIVPTGFVRTPVAATAATAVPTREVVEIEQLRAYAVFAEPTYLPAGYRLE